MTTGPTGAACRSPRRWAIAMALAVLFATFPCRAAEPSPTSGASATVDRAPVDPAPHTWSGLPKVRELFPLTTGFLVLEPTSAFVLSAGEWRASATITLSNTFTAQQDIERALTARSGRSTFDREMFELFAAADTSDQTFYLDAQMSRLLLELQRGLGRGFELVLAFPLVEIHGGFTDALVEPFHDAFGFEQEGRSGARHDRIGLFVSGQGLDLAIEAGSGLEPGDVEVGLRKRLVGRSTARALAVEVEVKLPTGDERLLISSGAVDVGLGLVGSRCWRQRCLHAMLGLVWAGGSETLGTERQAILNAVLGWEERLSERWGLALQGSYWESYLGSIGFEHFAEDTVQLALTASRRIGRTRKAGGEIFFGLSENALSFKNSADVNFHFGWRRRFE